MKQKVGFTILRYYLLAGAVFFLPLLYAPRLEAITRLKISNLLYLCCGLLLLPSIFHERMKIIRRFAPLWLFLVLNATAFAMVFPFSGISQPVQWIRGGMTLFWMTFGVALAVMIALILDSKDKYIGMIRCLVLSCTMFSLVGLYQYIGYIFGFSTGQRFTELAWLIPRLSSTALEPLYFANILVLFMPISILCCLTGTPLYSRKILFPMAGIQILALILTFSAGGWFSAAVAVVFTLFLQRRRLKTEALVPFGATLIAVFLILIFINQWVYPDLVYGFKGTLSKVMSVGDIQDNYTRIATATNTGVRFEETDFPPSVVPNTVIQGSVILKNTGTLTWERMGMVPVVVQYQWADSEGRVLDGDILSRIEKDVSHGENLLVDVMVRVPSVEGAYQLILDVAQHNVGRFSSFGADTLTLPLTVDRTALVPGVYLVDFHQIPEAIRHSRDNLEEYYPNTFSSLDRMWLFVTGLNMFKSSPVAGLGLGRSGFLYNEYRPAYAEKKDFITSINNQYVEIMAESGIMGLLGFLLVVLYLIRQSFMCLKYSLDPELAVLLSALMGGFLGLAIQINLFSGILTLNYIWTAIGLLLAVFPLMCEAMNPYETTIRRTIRGAKHL